MRSVLKSFVSSRERAATGRHSRSIDNRLEKQVGRKLARLAFGLSGNAKARSIIRTKPGQQTKIIQGAAPCIDMEIRIFDLRCG